MLIIDNNISLILKNMVGRKCNGAHLDKRSCFNPLNPFKMLHG